MKILPEFLAAISTLLQSCNRRSEEETIKFSKASGPLPLFTIDITAFGAVSITETVPLEFGVYASVAAGEAFCTEAAEAVDKKRIKDKIRIIEAKLIETRWFLFFILFFLFFYFEKISKLKTNLKFLYISTKILDLQKFLDPNFDSFHYFHCDFLIFLKF